MSTIRALTFTALAAIATVGAACGAHTGPTPSPDVATVKVSQHGLYRAAVRSAVDPIPLRRLHGWTLHVETAAGAAVDGAAIVVDGAMPQHGHGLPTQPRVTRALGQGDYAIEGMKFSMGGWWRVRFAVRSTAGIDTVVFNLSL